MFEKYKFEGVFHFAAESHVDRSIDGPDAFIKTNIIGTYNLLEVIKRYYKKLIKILNLYMFQLMKFWRFKEGDYFTRKTPYNPSSPYSASKASSDHLVKSWGRTFGLPIIITNCSNNYGPFQFPEKLIPLMIINCLENKPLPIYGDGQNIRDWLFVSDHCRALYKIFKKGKLNDTYNIGGNNEIKNIDIVNIICEMLDDLKPLKNGTYKDLISFVQDRPGHDTRYAINSTKIQNEIGWKPLESFKTGIRKTIKWYLNNEDWWRSIIDGVYNQERLGGSIK